jgi:hypothetical protein
MSAVVVLFMFLLLLSSSCSALAGTYLGGYLFGAPKLYKTVRDFSNQPKPAEDDEIGIYNWVNRWNETVCKGPGKGKFPKNYDESIEGKMVEFVQGEINMNGVPRRECADIEQFLRARAQG